MRNFKKGIIKWGDGFYKKNKVNWLKVLLAFLVTGIFIFLVSYASCARNQSFWKCNKELASSEFSGFEIIGIIYAITAYALIACFILYFIAKRTKIDLDLALVILIGLPGLLFFLFVPNPPFGRLPLIIGIACAAALMYFAFKIRN